MMTRIVAFVAVLASLAAGIGGAQDAPLGPGDRGPRFLVTGAGGQRVPVDAGAVPVLAARITLKLERVTRKQALQEIARQAGLRLVYGDAALHLDEPIRIRADGITVAAALTDVLWDAGLDVVFSANRHAALVRRPKGAALPQAGVIVGRVTDVKTGEGLGGAEVWLEGTRWRANTTAEGRYRLTDVTPGSYTLAARRVGYGKQSRAVVIAEGAEVAVDVALQPVATQLNEIVTTVTGDQRRMELGHVVGRINADSLVQEAPVSSLSEVLTGRVPGLQVFQESGSVGGRVNVRIRGPNSLQYDNQPIVVVDGVRYTTQEKTTLFSISSIGNVEPTSPLNDLNPNDIESIEVVKGPSAATLYGTDAANGVVVITTKRGRPGPARWNAYAKHTTTSIPEQHFADIYWGWGTVSGIPNNPSLSCTLDRLRLGQCTRQDSVAALSSPLNDPQLTIFGGKPRREYGMNVAGGGQSLSYYLSGDFEDAIGPVQMPRALVEQLKARRGVSELPEEWREPNAFTKLNLRSNLAAVFGKRADIHLSSGYIRSNTRTLQHGSRVYDVGQSAIDYGNGQFSPAEAFVQTTNERVDRFLESATGSWRPVRWFSARANFGLDITNSHRAGFVNPGDQPHVRVNASGRAEDSRRQQVTTTAELGARATARRGRLSASTSVGVQYVRTFNSAFGATGTGLPPGRTAVTAATTTSLAQAHAETVLLGGYVEEVFGLNERLFLTGAVRVDGASTFGQDYNAAAYPKAGASWLVSEESFLPRLPGLDELRLRYAFGASGRQPSPNAAHPSLVPGTVRLNGVVQNTMLVNGLGNPELRPERVREHEFGFDATGLGNRLSADVTWFRRSTVDQHISQLGPSGRGSMLTNLGLTTQRGFEAQLKAHIVAARRLTWDVILQHSQYTTELVDVGGGTVVKSQYGGYVEGYPLGARFQQPILGWNDANGDGILAPTEFVRGDTAVYMGQSMPPRTQTLTSVLGLFEGRVRLSGLVERKTGFTQINPYGCRAHSCRAAVDRTVPLAEQAAALAANYFDVVPETANFTRLREVTVALDLPAALLRAVRLGRGTVVLSARNLALWTNFSGADPEVAGGGGIAGPGSLFDTSASSTIQPVAGGAAAGIPLGRVFSIRFDLGK